MIRFLLITLTLTLFNLSFHTVRAESYANCGKNTKARQLAQLILNDPLQKRSQLTCNPILSTIALTKAKEMARLGRVTHVGKNPANRRLVESGYPLSKIYPLLFENNVEAIAGGIKNPALVWQELKDSETHRSHLLGEHPFYLLQDEIGVGFYYNKNTPHVEYWVIYIAHQKDSSDYRDSIAKSKD